MERNKFKTDETAPGNRPTLLDAMTGRLFTNQSILPKHVQEYGVKFSRLLEHDPVANAVNCPILRPGRECMNVIFVTAVPHRTSSIDDKHGHGHFFEIPIRLV